MGKDKAMPLLLIEDDVADCIKFKDCANRRTDVTFIGMTDSSEEGISLLKTRLPEGIILDLQLLKGRGSGLKFLTDLKGTDMAFRPIVVVTTSNQSKLVYNHVEGMGVDWVFCKKQPDYSADLVIDTLVSLRESLHTMQRDGLPNDLQTIESPEEQRVRISTRIDTELDLVGVRARYKGRSYLHEAIYLLINSNAETGSVIDQVANKHRLTYSSVSRVMQTAINNAWDSADIDELKVYYTFRVSARTGVPSASDFIYYYAEKIRNSI